MISFTLRGGGHQRGVVEAVMRGSGDGWAGGAAEAGKLRTKTRVTASAYLC